MGGIPNSRLVAPDEGAKPCVPRREGAAALHEKLRTDVEVGGEFADVRQRQVSVATMNHRAQVLVAVEQSGKVGCGQSPDGRRP